MFDSSTNPGQSGTGGFASATPTENTQKSANSAACADSGGETFAVGLVEVVVDAQGEKRGAGVVAKAVAPNWDQFVSLMAHRVGPKIGIAFVPAKFKGTARNVASVAHVSLVVFDVEARHTTDTAGVQTVTGPEPPEGVELARRMRERGWRGLVASTFSHKDPAVLPLGVDHRRLRVVVVPSRPIRPDEYRRVLAGVQAGLGLEDAIIDSACKHPAAFFYLPRVPEERWPLREFFAIEGAPVDVDTEAPLLALDFNAPVAAARIPGPVSDDQATLRNDLRSALHWLVAKGVCDPDGYDDWVTVGQRLKSLDEPGRALFHEFSAQSPRYDRDETDEKWETFTAERTSYRAIFREAQDHGWTNPQSRKAQDPFAGIDASEFFTRPAPDIGEAIADSRLRICDIDNLTGKSFPAVPFCVEKLIPLGVLTLWGGHGGGGKSSLASVLAMHIAVGRAWAGLAIKQCRVLFVSYEDPESLVMHRMQKIAAEYGLDLATVQKNLTIIDATKASPIMVEKEKVVRGIEPSYDGALLRDYVQAERFGLVIIDNASDAFGGDENNRRQVRTFIRYLAEFIEPHEGAIVLLAHINKAAAQGDGKNNNYSGTTAWHNSARSRIVLGDNQISQEKLNVAKKLDAPITIAWTEQGVPVPVANSVIQAQTTQREAADDLILLACLAKAQADGGSINAAQTGINATWHELQKYSECPREFSDDVKRVKDAISRCLRAGGAIRESYREDGKAKSRLVITDVGREKLARETRTAVPQ